MPPARVAHARMLALPNMMTARARYRIRRPFFGQLLFADWARFGHHVGHNLGSVRSSSVHCTLRARYLTSFEATAANARIGRSVSGYENSNSYWIIELAGETLARVGVSRRISTQYLRLASGPLLFPSSDTLAPSQRNTAFSVARIFPMPRRNSQSPAERLTLWRSVGKTRVHWIVPSSLSVLRFVPITRTSLPRRPDA